MLVDALSLMEEFERSTAVARREKQQILANERRDDDERQARDESERREWEALEEALTATSAQTAAFYEHLDRYQTATVAALMDNEAAQAEVRARLDEMLQQAYKLPDGRRVFRSEDGQHVFDEAGSAIDRETIDPAAIGDRHPKWETFGAGRAEEVRLEQERAGLLRFQERLDEARETVERKPASKGDLDALDADLKDAMPDAVRRQLGGNAPKPADFSVTQDQPDLAIARFGRQGQHPISAP